MRHIRHSASTAFCSLRSLDATKFRPADPKLNFGGRWKVLGMEPFCLNDIDVGCCREFQSLVTVNARTSLQ